MRAAGADCVVALGGGSTIGLGKAIAVRTGADQVAVPTTYAGSEMTDILGETAEGRKTTRRDPAIRPETVIYDVALTLGLPPALTATSGLNALAHAVEALYAPRPQPGADADGAARRSRRWARRCRRWPPRRATAPRAGAGALRRLALRRGARRHDDGAAPQALPRARRLVRAAAFRDARGDPAACRRLQRRGGAGSCWRRSARRSAAAAPGAALARARRGGSARRGRCGSSASPRPTSTGPPTSRWRTPYWNPRPVDAGGDPRAARGGLGGRAAGGMSLAGREIAVVGAGIGGLAAATGAGAARRAGAASSSRRRRWPRSAPASRSRRTAWRCSRRSGSRDAARGAGEPARGGRAARPPRRAAGGARAARRARASPATGGPTGSSTAPTCSAVLAGAARPRPGSSSGSATRVAAVEPAARRRPPPRPTAGGEHDAEIVVAADGRALGAARRAHFAGGAAALHRPRRLARAGRRRSGCRRRCAGRRPG